MLLDEILLFTRNPEKIAAFRTLFPRPPKLVAAKTTGATMTEDLETGHTFVQNALAKAAAGVRSAAMATLADDSGLVVDALNGAPGLCSERFAVIHNRLGADSDREARTRANNALLLEQLDGVPAEKRSAHFTCTLALALPERNLPLVDLTGMAGIRVLRSAAHLPYSWSAVLATGETYGTITTQAHGQAGFGYDPVFRSDDLGVTFADAAPGEKARVSHRARAVRILVEFLRAGRLI